MKTIKLSPDLDAKIMVAIAGGAAPDLSSLVTLALNDYIERWTNRHKYTTRGPKQVRGTWSQHKLRQMYPDITLTAQELKKEVWKEMLGCPDYSVSNLGNVVSRRTGREKPLKPFIQNQGYRQVTIQREGPQCKPLVHVEVAKLFVPNPLNKSEVNHKNGNHADVRACNLEWVDKAENTLHATNAGLRARGDHHPGAKLKSKDIHIIRKKFARGITSTKELAHKFNITTAQVVNIVNRKSWNHI